jgi:hypothetical protein
VARAFGLELTDDVFDLVVEQLTVTAELGLDYYQPKFFCDQAPRHANGSACDRS